VVAAGLWKWRMPMIRMDGRGNRVERVWRVGPCPKSLFQSDPMPSLNKVADDPQEHIRRFLHVGKINHAWLATMEHENTVIEAKVGKLTLKDPLLASFPRRSCLFHRDLTVTLVTIV
jgi:hypothetical protein